MYCPSRQGNNIFQENTMRLPVFNSERRSRIKAEFIVGLDHRQFSSDLGSRFPCGTVGSDPNRDRCEFNKKTIPQEVRQLRQEV